MARLSAMGIGLVFITGVLLAGPKIEFEKTTVDCGTLNEGKVDKISAVFVLKNTGDAPLKLENVRPGCGCTVVKYDTTIQAGKSAKIESSVNIAGYHSGPISKTITVTSNAANTPNQTLTITAKIIAIIDISEQYLSAQAQKKYTLYPASAKKDLKISAVSFKASRSEGPQWQSELPMVCPFTFAATDSVRADGFAVYKLEFTAPDIEQPSSGEFILKTNHPEKLEFKIRGNLSK